MTGTREAGRKADASHQRFGQQDVRMFVYTCKKCDAPAFSVHAEFGIKFTGLGTWHCSNRCNDGGKVKVTRRWAQ